MFYRKLSQTERKNLTSNKMKIVNIDEVIRSAHDDEKVY